MPPAQRAVWGLPPALARLLPSPAAVRALPLASTALLNRPHWQRGRAAQEARAFLDHNPQGPRDFLLLHRVCAASGGQSTALEASASHADGAGASQAIEAFLAASTEAFLAVFASGVPGLSRALQPSGADAQVLGERLLASLSAAAADGAPALPPAAPPGSAARVARVTSARVVDFFCAWEDFAGAEARRATAHARGRSIVLTGSPPPPSQPLLRFLHSWWHEHTLRPARSAAALVTVAYVCQADDGGGGAGSESVHTATWECALRAPPPSPLLQALPFLSYVVEAPLAVAQGWRLVSWDGMDPESLAHAGSSASGGSLALPLPSSLPLLRSAASLGAAAASLRMAQQVASAEALAGVWDTDVSAQWCTELARCVQGLQGALEGSEGGRRLRGEGLQAGAAAGAEGGEKGGEGEGEGAAPAAAPAAAEGRAPEAGGEDDTLRGLIGLVLAMFDEAKRASGEMAEVKRLAPWARRVDAEAAAEARYLAAAAAAASGSSSGSDGDATGSAAAQPQPQPPASPTSLQVLQVLHATAHSPPLMMQYYVHAGGREKLGSLFGELAVRFIDSRFYLLVGAVGLRAMVARVASEGQRQGCSGSAGPALPQRGRRQGEEGEQGEGEGERTLATEFEASLREILAVVAWEGNVGYFESAEAGEEDGEGTEAQQQARRGGRARRSAELRKEAAEGRREAKAREQAAVARLSRAMARLTALAKELK